LLAWWASAPTAWQSCTVWGEWDGGSGAPLPEGAGTTSLLDTVSLSPHYRLGASARWLNLHSPEMRGRGKKKKKKATSLAAGIMTTEPCHLLDFMAFFIFIFIS
jgi:hypothetical protein